MENTFEFEVNVTPEDKEALKEMMNPDTVTLYATKENEDAIPLLDITRRECPKELFSEILDYLLGMTEWTDDDCNNKDK